MIVLVIGGTGTLGRELVPILSSFAHITRIRILSRGEHKQNELADEWQNPKIDWFIGDVRDRDRVMMACDGTEEVYHLAAHKGVDTAEYNPMECVKTNVLGTDNVVHACRERGVKRAMFTSSDKAAAPLNLYGATKLVAEKLFVQGNVGRHHSKFACVRYGNVMGSNGSVIQKWKKGSRKITAGIMTRFFMTPKEAAYFVMNSMGRMNGGEIFVRKMKATTIGELYTSVFGNHDFVESGMRPGEKVHETLISADEFPFVTDAGEFFIIWPQEPLFPVTIAGTKVSAENHGTFMASGYSSLLAERFSLTELREMLG